MIRKISRRVFLGTSVLMAASVLVRPRRVEALFPSSRSLFMHNIHTGEFLKTTYFEKGFYIPEALKEVNTFFRDRITNEVKKIHIGLLDLICHIHQKAGNLKPLELVSGYRSLQTNSLLRQKSKAVAARSFHTKGMAADFYVPGIPLSHLRQLACSQGAGGVGYYPESGFIHVDIRPGPKKRWPEFQASLVRNSSRTKTL